MNPIKIALKAYDKIKKPEFVYAHCDVPCGIYETDTITHAADTVYKMVYQLLNDVKKPEENATKQEWLNYYNAITRRVNVKEEFAQRCKKELLILWTDYFKEEHLKKWPDLHEKFWKATKLCSAVKREVSIEKSKELINIVKEISEIFKETKK